MTEKHAPVDVPPVPERLSRTLAEMGEPRDSWPSRVREEVVSYVATMRDRGMPVERSLVALKQVAQPLFTQSEQLARQTLRWVLEVYYDRRSEAREQE